MAKPRVAEKGFCFKCKDTPIKYQLRGGTCGPCWREKVLHSLYKDVAATQVRCVAGLIIFDYDTFLSSVALSESISSSPGGILLGGIRAVVLVGDIDRKDDFHYRYYRGVRHMEAPVFFPGTLGKILQRRYALEVAAVIGSGIIFDPRNASTLVQTTLRDIFLGDAAIADCSIPSADGTRACVLTPLDKFNDEEILTFIHEADVCCDAAKVVCKKASSTADSVQQMDNLTANFVKESLQTFSSAIPNVLNMTQRMRQRAQTQERSSCFICLREVVLCSDSEPWLPFGSSSVGEKRGLIKSMFLCEACKVAARDCKEEEIKAVIDKIKEQAVQDVDPEEIVTPRTRANP